MVSFHAVATVVYKAIFSFVFETFSFQGKMVLTGRYSYLIKLGGTAY